MSSILNFDFWNEYLGRLKSTFSVVLLLSYSAWLLSKMSSRSVRTAPLKSLTASVYQSGMDTGYRCDSQ